MRTNPNLFLIASVLMAFLASACGKPKTQAAIERITARAGAKVECENPIELEQGELNPIHSQADLPAGKFVLSSIRAYMLVERTGDSFALTASSSDQFTPHMSCNGVHPATADPATVASKDEAPVYGSFRIHEWFDTELKRKSENQRVIFAEFIADKAPALATSLVAVEGNTEDTGLGDLKQERFSVEKDTFVTVRLYKTANKTLERRYKLELPADPAGKRVIQFVVATYERTT